MRYGGISRKRKCSGSCPEACRGSDCKCKLLSSVPNTSASGNKKANVSFAFLSRSNSSCLYSENPSALLLRDIRRRFWHPSPMPKQPGRASFGQGPVRLTLHRPQVCRRLRWRRPFLLLSSLSSYNGLLPLVLCHTRRIDFRWGIGYHMWYSCTFAAASGLYCLTRSKNVPVRINVSRLCSSVTSSRDRSSRI